VTRVELRDPRRYEVLMAAPLSGIRGGSVFDLCDQRQPTTCLVFESELQTLSVGDETEVLFILDSGEAFLAGEEWANEDLGNAAINVGFWLAILLGLIWATEDLVRNWRARRRDAPV
jgi:hypothetical protein